MFEVLVTYPAELYPAIDSQLTKQFGYADTSGMGFGVRENIWTFDLKEDAERVVATIKRDFKQCEVDLNF